MILNTVSIHTVDFCKDDPLGGRELEKCFNFLCCLAAVVHQDGRMNISVFLGRQTFAFVLSDAERVLKVFLSRKLCKTRTEVYLPEKKLMQQIWGCHSRENSETQFFFATGVKQILEKLPHSHGKHKHFSYTRRKQAGRIGKCSW